MALPEVENLAQLSVGAPSFTDDFTPELQQRNWKNADSTTCTRVELMPEELREKTLFSMAITSQLEKLTIYANKDESLVAGLLRLHWRHRQNVRLHEEGESVHVLTETNCSFEERWQQRIEPKIREDPNGLMLCDVAAAFQDVVKKVEQSIRIGRNVEPKGKKQKKEKKMFRMERKMEALDKLKSDVEGGRITDNELNESVLQAQSIVSRASKKMEKRLAGDAMRSNLSNLDNRLNGLELRNADNPEPRQRRERKVKKRMEEKKKRQPLPSERSHFRDLPAPTPLKTEVVWAIRSQRGGSENHDGEDDMEQDD